MSNKNYQKIEIVLGVVTVIVLTVTLITVAYTMLVSQFQEVYKTEDELEKELLSNDDLNKIYVEVEDPHEKVDMLINKGNRKYSLEWSKIQDLRSGIFNYRNYDSRKNLRQTYIYFTRVLSFTEKTYYAFNPPSYIRWCYLLAGFNVNHFKRGTPWIKSWIYDIADNPIFLLAFHDYYIKGGFVDKELCETHRTIINEKLKENKKIEIDKIFPELNNPNSDFCSPSQK